MANIVELREKSMTELLDMLEGAREELFNLRFQKAAGSLQDTGRMKVVQREIAQLHEVIGKREWAIKEAAQDGRTTAVLANKKWQASASYVYETGVWQVAFTDEDGQALANVNVDLNKKRRRTRRQRANIPPVQKVVKVEVA
jgi:large subunit ribosomal protein L29